jgi:hypothetical protein
VRIVAKSEEKNLKNVKFGQNSQCKVEGKEGVVSEEFVTLKRNQIIFIETIGKMPCRHLWNWPDRTHGRFKGMKE